MLCGRYGPAWGSGKGGDGIRSPNGVGAVFAPQDNGWRVESRAYGEYLHCMEEV
jgi:hypothetical protein